ncbi:MAG: heavy metal translocating P-type ATPase [Treponema sp.]|nr:heavy metal translocating P-type ATPase [Candidatus Treponema equifaecale]
MNIQIHHYLPGRIRLHYDRLQYSSRQAILATTLIAVQEGVLDIDVNTKIGSFLIYFDESVLSKNDLISLFKALTGKYLEDKQLLDRIKDIPESESIFGLIAETFAVHYLKKWFLPVPIKNFLLAIHLLPRIFRAFYSCLTEDLFNTDLLDATALTVSFLTGDYQTASNINMLLGLGEDIEEVTKQRSYDNLAQQLLSMDDQVQKVEGNSEETVSVSSVKKGDMVVFRAGNQILADGIVHHGEGLVNQASITGESLPVEKKEGAPVFAGTIVEEGEIYVVVQFTGNETKVNNIIRMIDNSQNLKAAAQKRSEDFAQKIVPFNFLLTGLTWFITKDIKKTVSTLMVDYSCALKLSAPISVLSAMREAAESGISIKGGKYLEAVAEADTIIFDKTGTLTYASPTVNKIYAFEGYTEEKVLTLAACLEEHFPHPLGRAVVNAATQKNLIHPELHTKVDYIVAHGIASTLGGKKTCIGSAHFIFDDEGIPVSGEAREIKEKEVQTGNSLLYLSYDGKLVGIIGIGDPVRSDAKNAVENLKKLGISQTIMITGDTEGAARKIADQTGIDKYHAQALPEDKVHFVEEEKRNRHKVVMIGDGINDAPALSAADIGISIDGASPIAGDTADINLSHDGLQSLVTVRKLGRGLLERMYFNERTIIGVNSFLLAGGVLGLISPTLAAILHNTTTIGISLSSMRPILPEGGIE